MSQNILMAGATGFLGQAIIEHRLSIGDQVTVLYRNRNAAMTVFSDTVSYCDWQTIDCEQLAQFDLVINLCGANIGEKRWTKHRKTIILQSRLTTTETLARLCSQLGTSSPRLLNASAIGIYGPDQNKADTDSAATEATPITLRQPENFLNAVGYQWEQATSVAKKAGVSVVNLRFAPVLSFQGGMLGQLLPLFRKGLGQIIGSGKQKFSWVSLQDVLLAIDFLCHHPSIQDAVNIVAPQICTQKQFAQSLANTVKKPLRLKLPAFAIKLMFGTMGQELLLDSLSVAPQKLEQAGFKFTAPTLEQCWQQQAH